MARWAMGRKQGLGQVGAGPKCQAQKGKEEIDYHVPTVHQVLPCKKGGKRLPILQVGRPRPESGSFLPRDGPGMQKGISESEGLAGLDAGWHVHWPETSSQWPVPSSAALALGLAACPALTTAAPGLPSHQGF